MLHNADGFRSNTEPASWHVELERGELGGAVLSAWLRAKYDWLRGRRPDAIQVATAIRNRAELIVTNDDRWRRLAEISDRCLEGLSGAATLIRE